MNLLIATVEMLRTSGSLYIQNPKSLITITFDPQEFVTIRVCNSKLINTQRSLVPRLSPRTVTTFHRCRVGETLGTRLHSANMLNRSLSNVKPLSIT